jgi:hypothetical protein
MCLEKIPCPMDFYPFLYKKRYINKIHKFLNTVYKVLNDTNDYGIFKE